MDINGLNQGISTLRGRLIPNATDPRSKRFNKIIEKEIRTAVACRNFLERGLTREKLMAMIYRSRGTLFSIQSTLASNGVNVRTPKGKQIAKDSGLYSQRDRLLNLEAFLELIDRP